MPITKCGSIAVFFENVRHQAVEDCATCGECMNKCPVLPILPINNCDTSEIMQHMIDFLENGYFSEEVYLKTFSCAGCCACTDSCPIGIDPMLLHEAAKVRMIENGHQPSDISNSRNSDTVLKPSHPATLSETKPFETRWLQNIPPYLSQGKTVIFLGCVVPTEQPDILCALLDILDHIDLDYIAIAGGDLCCGAPFCPGGGQVEESEKRGRKLVDSLKALSPEKVILVCPGCHRQFIEFIPHFIDIDFQVLFYTQFLSENIKKFNFSKSLEATVALHDSCVLARRIHDTISARNLLKTLPGLKLVEMEHNRSETHCCGGLTAHAFPQISRQLAEPLLADAEKAGINYMVNNCPGCHANLSQFADEYSFGLTHITSLLLQSLK